MSLHDCLEFIPTLAKYGAAHSIGQTNRQEPCIARIQNYSDNEWTNEWQISKNKKVTNKAPPSADFRSAWCIQNTDGLVSLLRL